MSTWGHSSEKKKSRAKADKYTFDTAANGWTKSSNNIDQSSTKAPSSTNTITNDYGKLNGICND